MATAIKDQSELLRHGQIKVEGSSIHVVQGGKNNSPSILFLHGWPESWALYEDVLNGLSKDAHVVAIDLPGVGLSEGAPTGNDKRTLAKYIHGVIQALNLKDVTLVGHDCGGMIAYASIKAYPDDFKSAVIMNTVVPGVDPWTTVISNPYIWHFAFHSVPELPEKLVVGREGLYFDFFFNFLAGSAGVSEDLRDRFTHAYTRPEALKTGFDWYRTFTQDAKDNAAVKDKTVDIPVLYLRGDAEKVKIDEYLKGFRDNGLRNIEGQIIPNSGHFSPSENPEATIEALQKFITEPQGTAR